MALFRSPAVNWASPSRAKDADVRVGVGGAANGDSMPSLLQLQDQPETPQHQQGPEEHPVDAGFRPTIEDRTARGQIHGVGVAGGARRFRPLPCVSAADWGAAVGVFRVWPQAVTASSTLATEISSVGMRD